MPPLGPSFRARLHRRLPSIIRCIFASTFFVETVTTKRTQLRPLVDLPPWTLQSLQALGPGGRYTQIRSVHGEGTTIVYNGIGGLFMSTCAAPASSCRRPWKVRAVEETDPRFVRMEIWEGQIVLLYTARNNTAVHLTVCGEEDCGTGRIAFVLEGVPLCRHVDFALRGDDAVVVASYVAAGGSGDDVGVSYLETVAVPLGNYSTLGNATSFPRRRIATGGSFALDTRTGLPVRGLEMPRVVCAEDDGGCHAAYWDVGAGELVLLWDIWNIGSDDGRAPKKTVVVAAAADGDLKNPGAWPRMVVTPDSGVTIVFFDLPAGTMMLSNCFRIINPDSEVDYVCDEKPYVVEEGLGMKDYSDYGLGAFPEFRVLSNNTYGGPTLVYFSDIGSTKRGEEQGQLKILECLAPTCNREIRRYVLGEGRRGFGRDPSVEMVHVKNSVDGETTPHLLVSFLDLNGEDNPENMTARLAVFTRSTSNAYTTPI